MLPVNSLSIAANSLRALLIEKIAELSEVSQVMIGSPADTLKDQNTINTNCLNLFFYDLNYDGYPADGISDNPFFVRLYCLVTALGISENGLLADSTISVGENELRLIGEVMQVFHETPVLSIKDKDDEKILELQVVPHNMNLDNLNHIWSTQSDISYRLSVAYELSLAPVPLKEAVERSPRVGEIGASSQANLDQEPLPAAGYGIGTSAPAVPRTTVDVRRDLDWAPHICFVDGTVNSLFYVLSIPVSKMPAVGPMKLKVLVAGNKADQVNLVWEVWDSVTGWAQSGSPKNAVIGTDTIDPYNIDSTLAVEVDLPIKVQGQVALYAERAWERPGLPTVTLRSNLLLVTVLAGGV